MKTQVRFVSLLLLLIALITGGTVFFKLVEGWSWVDSYFFTVVTLSTVGYGSLVPATTLGKIGTTLFIFVGLGVFALAIQQFADFAIDRRERKLDRRKAQRVKDGTAEDATTRSSGARNRKD